VGLLALVVVATGAGLGWNAYRAHHRSEVRRAIVQTEALLQNAHPPGITLDRSGTACHGIGDLCAQSQSSPLAALTQLTAGLRALGLDLGSPTCTPGADDLGSIYGATCQATGSHHGASVWAVAGRHTGPYWSSPVWLAVTVQNPDYQPPAAPTVAHPTLSQVLPAGWAVTPMCTAGSPPPCNQVSLRVDGSALAAAKSAARKLEAEGFGVRFSPVGHGVCRSVTGTKRCLLSGEKYLTPDANLVVVTVLLEQQGPNAVMGRAGIT
jgi:hypothetical protein